jgi:hypothetical protein
MSQTKTTLLVTVERIKAEDSSILNSELNMIRPKALLWQIRPPEPLNKARREKKGKDVIEGRKTPHLDYCSIDQANTALLPN